MKPEPKAPKAETVGILDRDLSTERSQFTNVPGERAQPTKPAPAKPSKVRKKSGPAKANTPVEEDEIDLAALDQYSSQFESTTKKGQ